MPRGEHNKWLSRLELGTRSSLSALGWPLKDQSDQSADARETNRMLWWFIGIWLASAALVPVLWLLGAVYPGIFIPGAAKQGTEVVEAKRGRRGRYVLAGLVTAGGLLMLYFSSFHDPGVRTS